MFRIALKCVLLPVSDKLCDKQINSFYNGLCFHEVWDMQDLRRIWEREFQMTTCCFSPCNLSSVVSAGSCSIGSEWMNEWMLFSSRFLCSELIFLNKKMLYVFIDCAVSYQCKAITNYYFFSNIFKNLPLGSFQSFAGEFLYSTIDSI